MSKSLGFGAGLGREMCPCLAAQVAVKSTEASFILYRRAHMEQEQASGGPPGDTINSKG